MTDLVSLLFIAMMPIVPSIKFTHTKFQELIQGSSHQLLSSITCKVCQNEQNGCFAQLELVYIYIYFVSN